MRKMKERHKIVGDVRAKGCLMGIELVKDRDTKEPYPASLRAGQPSSLASMSTMADGIAVGLAPWVGDDLQGIFAPPST